MRVVNAIEPEAEGRPSDGRRRVLIEDENPALYHLMIRFCPAGEYEFAACQGPFVVAGGCPVLRGEPCPKVEWADTILNLLDHREPANAALLHALRRRLGDAAATTLDTNPSTYCFTRRNPRVPAAAEEKEYPHAYGR